ncbi:hypothetical protein [Haloferula sp. BvORR071]|uniref:SCO family protein n=1 Tax=Haloferula sp. BvORR071 TaxID=1396141 RepID=UPI0005595A21|nr:hypothetical protein [Haloferula sp. BvORR071]
MSTSAEKLEPAVRDPRKLRNTALILIALIVLGGALILMAYNKAAKNAAKDATPSYVGRIEKNLKVWRQDGSEGSLADMEGQVYVIAPVLFSKPEGWPQTREVLKRLSKHYAGNPDFHIVCLTIDPDHETPEKLGIQAKELGAELPQWWLAATREESVHKFLKNVLKMETIPYVKDGEWIYDGTLVVIDRDRHIRKGTTQAGETRRNNPPFNFEKAASWDAQHSPADDPNRVSRDLENLLTEVIDGLLAKPVTKP